MLSTLISIAPANAYKGSILCPLSENNLVIDGKWSTADEWTDASELEMAFYIGSGQVILRTKHDANYLYVLVDFVSDKTENKEQSDKNDGCTLAFDCDHDAATSPQKDDFRWGGGFNAPEKFGTWFNRGDGSSTWPDVYPHPPQDLLCNSSMDATNDPYDQEPHRIYEFRMPKKYFKEDAIGFYVWCRDGEGDVEKVVGCWPLVEHDIPNKWTELKFSNRFASQTANLKTLMFPVKDVELSYLGDAKWYIVKGREISIEDMIAFKPVKVKDLNYEISMSLKRRIMAPSQTSLIDTFFYAMNGSTVNELKSAQPDQQIDYSNVYAIDGREIRDIRGAGVLYTRTKFKIGNAEYFWSMFPIATNFDLWTGTSQAGKFIQIWNLDPVKLEEGQDYEFNGMKWKTLAASTSRQGGDWTERHSWIWEKETGILLAYATTANNSRTGWRTSENIKLDEVYRTETELNIYVSPPKAAPGESLKIAGALSVLGQTSVSILITDPEGIRTSQLIDCNSLGEFSIPLSLNKQGKYSVRANWKGTILHEHASSRDVEFTVAPARVQFYLKVESPYGQCQGEALYYEGDVATFSVSPIRIRGVEPFVDVVFVGWTGASTSKEATATIVMDSDKTVTAVWSKDYGGLYSISMIVGLAIVISLSFILIRKRRRHRK